MSVHSRFSIIFASLLFVSATHSLIEAAAITPGDTVVVAKDNVQLGVRDKPMVAVNSGTEFIVTEVRGNWLGGYTLIEGNKRYGWIHQTEVTLAPAVKRRAASGPVKPDDPQAVAAWKKLGVTLNLDEAGNIQQLQAAPAVIQDADLIHLGGLHSLLSLDLSNQPLTDESLMQIAGCTSLIKLYLGGTNLSDAGLEKLKSLVGLEVLACPRTKLSGASLRHISALSDLQVLNVDHCDIADDQLADLGQLPRLEVLVLAHTKITDAGIEYMRQFPKLRVLNLDGTHVKGPGLDNLQGLTELRMLYVRDCPVEAGVTDKLDDKMPGLAIYD